MWFSSLLLNIFEFVFSIVFLVSVVVSRVRCRSVCERCGAIDTGTGTDHQGDSLKEYDEMKVMLLSISMMDILRILKVLLRTLKDLTMLGA